MSAPTPAAGGRPEEVTLGLTTPDRIAIVAGMGLLGAVIGALVPWVLEQAARLPWAPFTGPLRLLEELGNALPVGTAVAGAAALAAMTLIGTAGSARLTVSPAALRVATEDDVRVLPREQVAAVFRDGDEVVVLDDDRREVERATVEASASSLARALREHGYPYRDGDPRL